jgi:hypothetical protein
MPVIWPRSYDYAEDDEDDRGRNSSTGY